MPCCASAPQTRDTIILLPDASGRIGSIIVSSGGQEVQLSKVSQAVTVERGSPPSSPFILSREEVTSLAGPALNVLPPPPRQYLLYFEHDSIELTKESKTLFADIIKTIKNNPPIYISIAGHTDTMGDREYNFELSYKRAKVVSDLLTEQGMDGYIMHITYYGKEIPLIKTGDQVHEPRNRRTEITIR